MRFKSKQSKPFQVFAVTGVNTISFGIKADQTAKKGLLGFAVERVDPAADERYTMPGFKVFESLIPKPNEDTHVTTWDHPVQSLVWDDFTAKPDHEYEYVFHPLKGKPKNLDRSAKPISIRVKTEPLFTNGPGKHDVFFNRGVASSQAYRRKFGTTPVDSLPPEKQEEALKWLTRDLKTAALRFIDSAKKGDKLRGCFYEFRYEPIAQALKKAIDRDVDVQLIIDGKVNEHTEKDKKTGKETFVPSFPREDNLKMLKAAGITKKHYKLRQAKPTCISHNKFMVLLRKGKGQAEVWTGSTNISEGGFSGQTNVGHWVRDNDIAKQYLAYWELMKTDPGAQAGFSRSDAIKANKALHKAVGDLHDVPTVIEKINNGSITVFSPRAGSDVLELYVRLVDSGKSCCCITLAFGINDSFKQELVDNTDLNHIIFMLLEKEDQKNPRSTKPFVKLGVTNNVYEAWGSYLDDPVYQWARETNTRKLQLNQHVAYIHSKFLLMDPLGDDPIVVTGSANFSTASTNDNDENMLIVRGDQRVADIYFTEFNRLFNHYYFRSVAEALKKSGHELSTDGSLFLDETDGWLKKYKPKTLKAKRLNLYVGMDGAKVM
jgi:phosphatidylserine/phosphatidylglycerophosphate/cardiolipin synthase-like enzyme